MEKRSKSKSFPGILNLLTELITASISTCVINLIHRVIVTIRKQVVALYGSTYAGNHVIRTDKSPDLRGVVPGIQVVEDIRKLAFLQINHRRFL